MADAINPSHYRSHESGIEVINLTECFNFTLGNAIKYVLRHKGKNGREDLEKACWYIEREVELDQINKGFIDVDLPEELNRQLHFALNKFIEAEQDPLVKKFLQVVDGICFGTLYPSDLLPPVKALIRKYDDQQA